MATIQYVREIRGAAVDDHSRGYAYRQQPVTRVVIGITLTGDEARCLRDSLSGRRPRDVLGSALSWQVMVYDSRTITPIIVVYHSVTDNPHHTKQPHQIAERTLAALQVVLNNLRKS